MSTLCDTTDMKELADLLAMALEQHNIMVNWP